MIQLQWKSWMKLSDMQQSDQQLEQFRGMYEEACERADTVETNSKKEASKHGHQLAEMEKRHSIALERVETKAARAIAALEDKDAQIKELNVVINDMKDTIKKMWKNMKLWKTRQMNYTRKMKN